MGIKISDLTPASAASAPSIFSQRRSGSWMVPSSAHLLSPKRFAASSQKARLLISPVLPDCWGRGIQISHSSHFQAPSPLSGVVEGGSQPPTPTPAPLEDFSARGSRVPHDSLGQRLRLVHLGNPVAATAALGLPTSPVDRASSRLQSLHGRASIQAHHKDVTFLSAAGSVCFSTSR